MRPSLLPTLLLCGCELLPLEGTSSDTGTPVDTATPTEAETTEPGRPGPTTTATEPEEPHEDWWFSGHPCTGNRTDTMWFDDRDTVWVGCGTTTVGTGIFLSEDGGRTWRAPATAPAGYFDAFRASSISRSADGLLYVAGIDTLGAERVVSLADDGTVGSVFAAGGQVWNTFHVGTFRRNSQGVAVAESLTGTSLVARFDDDAPFADGYGWWGSTGSYQILDLVLHDDVFYAVGSTITQPPFVFLPPPEGQDPAVGFTLVPIQLVSGIGYFEGELWGLDVDDAGLVTAGVDQDRDVGVVFWSQADPWDLDAWGMLDVSSLVPSEPTWMRGACRGGDTLVAVGEYSQRGDGLVLRSDDGGLSWADVTPYALTQLPAVHRCEVFEDGDVAIAGADGVFAMFDPA